MERSGRHDIYQMIKLSKTTNAANWHLVPLVMWCCGRDTTSPGINIFGINLAKKYLTNSNHKETTRQIQVVKHKTADIYSSKMWTPRETKRSWSNCSRLKENKDYKFNGWSLIGSWLVLLQVQCTYESLGDLTKLRALIHCVRNGPWESAFLMSSQVTPVLLVHSVKFLGCDYNIVVLYKNVLVLRRCRPKYLGLK